MSSDAERPSRALHLGQPAFGTVGGKASLATPDGSGRRPAATPREGTARRGARLVWRARAGHTGSSSAVLRDRPRERPGPRRTADHAARPRRTCPVLSMAATLTETPSRGIGRRPRNAPSLLARRRLRPLLGLAHYELCLLEVHPPSTGASMRRARATARASLRPSRALARLAHGSVRSVDQAIGSVLSSKLTSGDP